MPVTVYLTLLPSVILGSGWWIAQLRPSEAKPLGPQGIPRPRRRNHRRVFISGQKRRVGAIRRELRRRSAIEPIIAHMRAEGTSGAVIQALRWRCRERHPLSRRT